MKKLLTAILLTSALLAGCGQKTASESQVSSLAKLTKINKADSKTAASQEASNNSTKARIESLQADLSSYHQAAKDAADDQSALSASAQKAGVTKAETKAPAKAAAQPTVAAQPNDLAAKDFAGQQEIVINNDDPGFSAADLSTKAGAWERYTPQDSLGRAVDAQALLNQSLMPTAKREALTVDPTGWHNRKTAHGWLYNRSHLIGFQLSGENNNAANLITGTMSLNNPLMLAHEMDVASYLKASSSRYVRYEVKPWYRGNELVARGVQMRAQSIGDNTIHFNVYIFNVEAGYTINYATGENAPN